MATTSVSPYTRTGTPKPEDGIAEWASKIKAMQEQVDADEEAEQRKLEEEIAASRLARQRRSRGVGYGSRVQSLDLSSESSKLAAIKDDSPVTADIYKSPSERQQSQDSALKKLMGDITQTPAIRNSPSASTTTPDSMSLAAFIGGRATGPRLNKHAPQQDAHDPTQFEQRARSEAPHPIFGTRGVAMPGMSTQFKPPHNSNGHDAEQTPSHDDMRTRRMSTSSVASRYLEQAAPRPVSPLKIASRDRTISTPARTVDSRSSAASSSSRPFTNVSPTNKPLIINTPTVTPSSPPSRPFTPQQPRSSTPSTPSPSLARPIQPSPRTSLGPTIPASANASPAFLKPPAQKDPTPSISRLQGRGFVQNMVKDIHSSPLAAKEEPNKPTGIRKASVLDRWQPENTPSQSPLTTAKPTPMRKSRTTAPPSSDSEMIHPKTVKHRPSLPSLQAERHPPSSTRRESKPSGGSPGLGSATTMMIFKPTEEPTQPPLSFSEVDELGVHRTGGSKVTFANIAPEARKPLAHPTKERAKKPRKTKSATGDASSTDATTDMDNRTVSSTPGVSSLSLEPARSREDTQSLPRSPGGRITDRWANNGIILSQTASEDTSAKSTPKMARLQALPGMTDPDSVSRMAYMKPGSPSPPTEEKPAPKMVGRQALPGMAAPDSSSPLVRTKSSVTGISSPSPRLPSALASPSPPSSVPDNASPSPRLTRIPSSGNRATVMDVAQVFEKESMKIQEPATIPPTPEPKSPPSPEREVSPTLSFARPQAALHSEKRRSSYDRFSAITLPPLKEEATPVSSPAGTLSRDTGKSLVQRVEPEVLLEEVKLDFDDGPLPQVDISLLSVGGPPYVPDSTVRDISVDVMIIDGPSSTALSTDINIFYDGEIIAIIHRKKSVSSGLVATSLWAWKGKGSQMGDAEERKLKELASRYGTSVIHVPQYGEPPALLHILGGQLAIRQGSRVHWALENTAMHAIRSRNGFIIIDELDLNIKNLCSAFSYCVSVLGTVYVWHGCGALEKERKAARGYARKLGENVVEIARGASEDDADMFWMVLGEEEYAQADYWRWRGHAQRVDPSIWLVNSSKGNTAFSFVPSLISHGPFHSSVFLLDCIWEVFVVIGKDARNQRLNIRLAISAAQGLIKAVSAERPYTPTIHVLIFPSQVPLDLRLQFREFDGLLSNDDSSAPDHMNLLSIHDALKQLQQTTWEKASLADETMLPLGLDPTTI